MDTTTLIIVAVLVIAVVILAAALQGRRRRREELKEQFGPEYEHAVDKYGDQHAAEKELQARQERVEALNIHPLPLADRNRFAEQWRQVQAEFVDTPGRAVRDADSLVQNVMEQRGYPLGNFEQRAADISVDHASVVSHYRTAHDIAVKQDADSASTEDLRQAMVHYRALFEDLLEVDEGNAVEDVNRNGAAARPNETGRQS